MVLKEKKKKKPKKEMGGIQLIKKSCETYILGILTVTHQGSVDSNFFSRVFMSCVPMHYGECKKKSLPDLWITQTGD